MTILGTFKRQNDGAYTGAIRTLCLDIPNVIIRPAEKATDQAPDFRVIFGDVEFGAAWKKTSREQREYLSVKFDDPSFAFPVNASLVGTGGGYALIWSRSRFVD